MTPKKMTLEEIRKYQPCVACKHSIEHEYSDGGCYPYPPSVLIGLYCSLVVHKEIDYVKGTMNAIFDKKSLCKNINKIGCKDFKSDESKIKRFLESE